MNQDSASKMSPIEREGRLWTASKQYMHGEIDVDQLENAELLYSSRLSSPKDYEEQMIWRIRWFLIIAITAAYTFSLISGLIGFWVTRDPRFLLFIAPTALLPLVRYLIPLDKRRYELELAKIEKKLQLPDQQGKKYTPPQSKK